MSVRPDLVTALYRRIFARRRFRRWNVRLLELSLHGLGLLNYENARLSGETHLIRKVLPGLLGDEPVIFDVGANVGEYSAALLAQFPGARIHAFEPHPRNCEKFIVPGDEARLHLHRCALGEVEADLTLFDYAEREGSAHASLHREVLTEIHGAAVATTRVPVDTVDAVAQKQGIDRIALLKIDVEGHELAVLKGASRLLAANAIRCIQFEFNEMNRVSRVFLKDFRALLPNHDLYRLLPKGMIRLGDRPLTTELFAYQNVFAKPKRRGVRA